MKLGLSSYSFYPMLASGALTIEGMFDWLAANHAEHLEIATFSFSKPGREADYDLSADMETLRRLEAGVARTNIPISGICVGAKLVFVDAEMRRAEIDQLKRHIELCAKLGIGLLRHDVVDWSHRLTSEAEFEEVFPLMVEACQDIASFAAAYGVTTSVEDHGFFMNGSARMKRLLHAVDRRNFQLTVDVGNFLCVDEDALFATRNTLADASFVHLKDFYIRRNAPEPGWLETLGGRFIRGSVFGHGDLETRMLVEAVVASGYEGFVSLEYEGNSPTLFGCETGLANIRRMLAEIGRANICTL